MHKLRTTALVPAGVTLPVPSGAGTASATQSATVLSAVNCPAGAQNPSSTVKPDVDWPRVHTSKRKLVTVGIAVSLCTAAFSGIAAAQAPSPASALGVAPAITCPEGSGTTGSTTVKSSVDWLRVHISPSVSAPAVGQLPGGAMFHLSGAASNGFACGYGKNGSTTVSGWASSSYLNFP